MGLAGQVASSPSLQMTERASRKSGTTWRPGTESVTSRLQPSEQLATSVAQPSAESVTPRARTSSSARELAGEHLHAGRVGKAVCDEGA